MTSNLVKYRGAVYRQAYLFTPEAEQYLYHCTTYGVVPDVAADGLSPYRSKYRDDSIYLTEPAGLVQWIQWVKAEAPYRHAPVVAVDDDGNEVQIPEDFEPDENALPLQPVVLRTKILGQKELDRCGTDDASTCLLQRMEQYFPEGSVPPYERPMGPRLQDETRDQQLIRHHRGLKQWERKRDQMEQQLKDRAKAYRTQQPIPPQELEIWTGDTWVPLQQWRKAKVPMDARKLFAHLTDSSARFDPYTLEKKTASAVRYLGAVYHLAARLPRYLYHGTSLHRWNQIVAGGYVTDLIYLADSIDGTDMYRLHAVEDDELEGIEQDNNAEVMVQFDLNRLANSGILMPDWDDVPTNMEQFPDASWVEQVAWDDSLKQLGTCSFKGNLKPAIKRVQVIR